MNEEKLDKIYEKLLECEIAFREIESEKRIKELECEKREIQYKIDDINHTRERYFERKEEMMAMFRNLKAVEEE